MKLTDMQRGALLYPALFLSAFLFIFATINRFGSIYDEGLILTGAMRVANGEIPHRDFYANYGPAQFYLVALLFKLFGPSAMAERLLDFAIKAAIATLSFATVRSRCRPAAAFAVYIACLIWLAAAGSRGGRRMRRPDGAVPLRRRRPCGRRFDCCADRCSGPPRESILARAREPSLAVCGRRRRRIRPGGAGLSAGRRPDRRFHPRCLLRLDLLPPNAESSLPVAGYAFESPHRVDCVLASRRCRGGVCIGCLRQERTLARLDHLRLCGPVCGPVPQRLDSHELAPYLGRHHRRIDSTADAVDARERRADAKGLRGRVCRSRSRTDVFCAEGDSQDR
jgi:hypothetical protein